MASTICFRLSINLGSIAAKDRIEHPAEPVEHGKVEVKLSGYSVYLQKAI